MFWYNKTGKILFHFKLISAFKLTFNTNNLINKQTREAWNSWTCIRLTYWQISIHNTYRLNICRDPFYFLYMHERKLNFLMKFFKSVTSFSVYMWNEQDIHKTTFFIYISLSSMFYNCKNMFSTRTHIYWTKLGTKKQ